MIRLRKKSKKTLYASYMEKKKHAMSVDVKETDVDTKIMKKVKIEKPEKKVKIEKSKKRDKENKNVPKEPVTKRTIVISVSSLKNGIGCSHICRLLQSYIESKKKSVIILNEQNSAFDYFDKFDYIILDYGSVNIDKIDMYKLSDIKIMMCILDNEYLKELYEKCLTEDKWYFFNHVPSELKGEVAAYMEDFNFYCVPACVPNALNKEIKREFAKVLKL